MSALQRQVILPFGKGTGGGITLQIVGDPGIYSDSLVHLLLVPDVDAALAADVGEARLGSSKPLPIPGGILQFSNSDTAALPAPPVGSTPEFKTMFAFTSEGQSLPPSAVGAWYDPATFQVRLSRPFVGAISYSAYTSRARTITYRPLTQSAPQGGAKTTYGVIAAYYQGALVTHQVEPPSVLVGNAVKELYRRYSYKIITANGEGEFELPPGYPASGAYPGKSLVIEVQGSTKFERVHEIGFLNSEGRADVYTPTVNILEPYVGDIYTPIIHCRIATLSPEEFSRDVIAKANDFVKSKGLGCTSA